MSRVYFSAIFALFFLLGSRTAHSIEKVKSSEVLEIATGEYAPMTGQAFKDGGPVTAVVTTILEKMNTKFHVSYVPWKRADDGVRKNNYWAAFPYVKSPEREKTFLFSAPITKSQVKFFVRKDAPKSMDSPASAWAGKILCRPAGYESTLQKPFVEKYKLLVEEPLTLESCYLMLKAKKVDLVPNTAIVGTYYINKIFGSMDDFKTLDDILPERDFHLMVNKSAKGANEFLETFNKTLAQMNESGELKKIYEKSAADVMAAAAKGKK